jgi:tetratricopeptide (TPR) repeat protein
MTLPLVLWVLDVYPLRRLGSNQPLGRSVRQWLLEKLPFIIPAAIAAVLAVEAKEFTGAVLPWDRHGLAARAGQACYGLIFYLAKTILPIGLSPLYQLTPQFNEQKITLVFFGLAVAGITLGLWLLRRSWPAAWAGWLCYVAILAPHLGIVQTGPQLAADRYSYLACLPWAALAAAGLFQVGRRFDVKPRAALPVALALPIVVALGLLTWRQSHYWKNSATLWQRALNMDPNSDIAHNNLGNYLVDQGKLEAAREHYSRALAIEPTYAEAHVNLGMVLSRQGKLEESMKHIRTGL